MFFMSMRLLAQNIDEAHTIYQYSLIDIDGNKFDFSCLEGKKILVVNTASKCMYAPQLHDLQKLYEKYKNNNFVVIACPANDFFNREPLDNKEIAKKYRTKYKISFPIVKKISVKGDTIHPLYDFLSHKSLNGNLDADVKWNFHKYLIDNNGFIYKSLSPATKPFDKEIVAWIEEK